MVSPLICCCSRQRTSESKTALRINCFFQSPAVSTLLNLSLSQKKHVWQMGIIFYCKLHWTLSHKSGCKIQFWVFKFSIFMLCFFFSFLFCLYFMQIMLYFKFGMQSLAFPSSPLVQGAGFSYAALTFPFLIF